MQSAKEYLDYLDKEMSIMGILSTFCVGAVALVLDRVGNAAAGTLFRKVWDGQFPYLLVGSGWLILAALFFYLQRSLLAYYYGSISYSLNNPDPDCWPTPKWLSEADSWATWIRYRIGFVFITLAFLCYAAALIGSEWRKNSLPYWPLWAAPVLVFTVQIPHYVILCRYRYEENPIRVFLGLPSEEEQEEKRNKLHEERKKRQGERKRGNPHGS